MFANLFSFELFLYPFAFLMLLYACFTRQIVESRWRNQESWGMAPQNLIVDRPRYISKLRTANSLVAAFMFALAIVFHVFMVRIERKHQEDLARLPAQPLKVEIPNSRAPLREGHDQRTPAHGQKK